MSHVAIRLARTYDAQRMQAELRHLKCESRVAAGYPGEAHQSWGSITLIAPAGQRETRGHARGIAGLECRPTEALERSPYLAEVLEGLPCPKRLARLMTLGPGGVIARHRDDFVSFEHGMLRLHVPVVSHPLVDFFIDDQRCDWKEGELWYGDFSKYHSAHNQSSVTRVHLVVDVLVNAPLLNLFPSHVFAPGAAAAWRARAMAASWSAAEDERLRRFTFDFRLPAGFTPPGTNHEPLALAADGSVQVLDGRLLLTVNEQPLLRLEPLSGGTLAVEGLAPGTVIECEFDQGHVVGATLVPGTNSSGVMRIDVRRP